MTHGEITVEIKSDSLMDAISVRDFLVTYNQVVLEIFSVFSYRKAFTNLGLCLKFSFCLKLNVVNQKLTLRGCL